MPNIDRILQALRRYSDDWKSKIEIPFKSYVIDSIRMQRTSHFPYIPVTGSSIILKRGSIHEQEIIEYIINIGRKLANTSTDDNDFVSKLNNYISFEEVENNKKLTSEEKAFLANMFYNFAYDHNSHPNAETIALLLNSKILEIREVPILRDNNDTILNAYYIHLLEDQAVPIDSDTFEEIFNKSENKRVHFELRRYNPEWYQQLLEDAAGENYSYPSPKPKSTSTIGYSLDRISIKHVRERANNDNNFIPEVSQYGKAAIEKFYNKLMKYTSDYNDIEIEDIISSDDTRFTIDEKKSIIRLMRFSNTYLFDKRNFYDLIIENSDIPELILFAGALYDEEIDGVAGTHFAHMKLIEERYVEDDYDLFINLFQNGNKEIHKHLRMINPEWYALAMRES